METIAVISSRGWLSLVWLVAWRYIGPLFLTDDRVHVVGTTSLMCKMCALVITLTLPKMDDVMFKILKPIGVPSTPTPSTFNEPSIIKIMR